MTIQQTKIYNWLIAKPGYLKKSSTFIQMMLPFRVTNVKHIDTALKAAKVATKISYESVITEDNN